MGQSIDYLRKREAECRQAAARATDPAVRQVHIQFADQYAAAIRAEHKSGKQPAPAPGTQIGG